MSETNKEILKRANEAISEGDLEGFLTFCTEDLQWTVVGDHAVKGKVAIREWMAHAYRDPPKFKVHRMIAEGDFVTAFGEITLKNENGQTAVHSYCDVWRFHEGRMAELDAFVIKTGLAH